VFPITFVFPDVKREDKIFWTECCLLL